MKKTASILSLLLGVLLSHVSFAQGGDPHSGHSMGNTGPSCVKAKVTRFKPEHLSNVEPGAEFSFAVSGALGPEHIHVAAKQIPIAVTTEDKETFILVKGKLPNELKGEPVRLTVKVKAKVSRCDAEEGILLKVSGG
jgi:hypothetical protein